MNHTLEILLVEDSPQDAELTIRALEKRNLANRLLHDSHWFFGDSLLRCSMPI